MSEVQAIRAKGRPSKAARAQRILSEEVQEVQVERPAMRPEMRANDPRAEAARRAAEIRGNLGGEMDEGTNRFDAPTAPPGWTYEWKRKATLNQEDTSYITKLKRKGWEEVPASRHPETMPPGWTNSTIERDGMILMQCPEEIVNEIKSIELRRARDQVRVKESQLTASPDGTFERNNPNIKKNYEAIPVPKS
jgi:hypothetical protein